MRYFNCNIPGLLLEEKIQSNHGIDIRIFINFRFTRQAFELKIKYFEHFVNFNCLFILIICSKRSLFKQEESSAWSSLD